MNKHFLCILAVLFLAGPASGQSSYVVNNLSLGVLAPPPYAQGGYANKTFNVVERLTLSAGFTVNAADGPFVATVIPGGQNATAVEGRNYQRTETVLVAGVTAVTEVSELAEGTEKRTTYTYMDGFGRTTQQVAVQASPQGKDIVSFYEYDPFGRQPRSYLPFVADGTAGLPVAQPAAAQAAFYANPPTGVPADSRPYSENTYDGARVTATTGPGQAWQAAGRKTTVITRVESAGQVRRWFVDNAGLPISNGSYAPGVLTYTETTGEDGVTTREYKDQWGNTVLTEVVNGATGIQTYYAYDVRGNLLAVIPPKAVELVRSESINWIIGPGIRDNLCYVNLYDPRGRLIEEYIPGKEVVYYVYDQWGRLVLSQDGNQRAASPDRWTFTKYDAFNRAIITGEYRSNSSRAALQATLATYAGHHESRANNAVGYTLNGSFPDNVTANDLLAITYYDDYDFIYYTDWDTEGHDFTWVGEAGFSGVAASAVLGQTTGSKTRVLGTGLWLNAVTYYDADYQPLQTIVENHLGGTDRATTEYDYTGQVTRTLYRHSSPGNTLAMLEEFAYDKDGRLTHTWRTVNNGQRVLVAQLKYNGLGNLIERNLHSTDEGGTFLQSVDYRQNIRGWPTAINNADLTANGANDDTNDLFGMELDYTGTVSGISAPARYNGNIAYVKWQANNLKDTPKKQLYGYAYNYLNMLTKATYAADNGGNWTADAGFYNVEYDYDLQGSFTNIKRYGNVENAPTLIDDLVFEYNNTNQVQTVTDSGSEQGFSEDIFNTPGITEYTYDANGNMVSDLNTQITDITYNILDKPERMTIEPTSGKIYLDFTYDAAGNKLSTSIKDANETELYRIDYAGGIHYVDNELAYMLTPQGRILKYGSYYEHEYHLRDHLGNVRVAFGYLHDTRVYTATMEPQRAAAEQQDFINIAANLQINKNHTRPAYDVPAPRWAKIVAKDEVGPALALEVSAGDRVSAEIFVNFTPGSTSNSGGAAGALEALATTFGTAAGEALYNQFAAATASLASAFTNSSPTTPDAYLNLIWVNSNNSNSEVEFTALDADAVEGFDKLAFNFTVPGNGTVYIYFANEGNDAGTQVYVDDFTVIHEKTTRSLNVTQVNDYYPFGGVMAGTAYTDEGRQAQLYKLNGNEVLEGEGIPTTLNLMNFNARLYNPASLSRSFSEAKPWACFWRWTRRGSLPAPIWRLGIIRLTLSTRTGNWLGLCR